MCAISRSAIFFLSLVVIFNGGGPLDAAEAISATDRVPAGAMATSPDEIARMLEAAARLYSLDPALMAAIAQVESGNDPNVVSPRGAVGLMQLMPQTAARFGVRNPSDPVENLLGAARFLKYLRQSSGAFRSLPDLLAAYNAGESTVMRYGGVPPYTETQNYVRKVLLAYLAQPPSSAPPRQRNNPARPVRYSTADAPVEERADPFRQLELIQRERTLAIASHARGNPQPGK
jgi:soluble lytic murein transglycosylase-like protein